MCGRSDGRTHTGPGGVLLIGGAPTRGEDYPGAAPLSGEAGRWVRQLVQQWGFGNTTWGYGIRCAMDRGTFKRGEKEGEAALLACRGYLAEDVRFVRPSRIVALGDVAARALLGDDVPRTAASHRAVGWLSASYLPDGQPVPVFLISEPVEALRLRTLRPSYLEDLRWALEGEPVVPPWGARYAVIDTPEDAQEAARQLRAAWADYRATTPESARDPYACLAYDVEATGLLWTPEYRLLCASLAPSWFPPESERAWLWTRKGMDDPEAVRPLLELLADPAIPKGGQNVKYDANGTRTRYGVEVRNVVADTRLMSRLVHPESDADLDALGWGVSCGGHKGEAAAALKRVVTAVNKATKRAAVDESRGQGALFGAAPEHQPVIPTPGASAKSVAYGLLPPHILHPYNGRDTLTTGRLVSALSRDIRADNPAARGARLVWDDIMQRATEVFSRMESRGFPINRDGVYVATDMVRERVDMARELIFKHAPDLNPDSPAAIGQYLYGKLGLTTERKTEGGAMATDRAALKENAHAHPVVQPLIDYSELTHLRETYLDGGAPSGQRYGKAGILRHLRAAADGTLRAHTTYNLDGARTGRLSSSDPNLQNIPRAEKEVGKIIKDLFVAPPGRVWVQLDYSQLELRVAAIETGDPVMIAIFASGVDYHLRTAELIAPTAFGLTPAEWIALSKEQQKAYRSKAKTINFGLLYGMGVKTLAARMGCDIATAQRTLDAILGKMLRLKAWIAERRRETQTTGLVWTRWKGQRAQHRQLHRLEYTDTIAVNTPVQGGASYFCVASVIEIEDWLQADGLADVAEMVGTVHDSVVLLAEERHAPEVAAGAAAIMESWDTGPVRLEVDAEWGRQWGSLQKMDLHRMAA